MKQLVVFRRVFLAAVAICIVSVAPQAAHPAAPCCDCPIPSVGIFDFVQNIAPLGMQNSRNRSASDYRAWMLARGF